MFTFSKRKSLAVTVGAAVAATGLTLAFGASSAGALPAAGGAKTGGGDNGDVKIHNSTTPVTDQRNEPQVCIFYLDAFNFDSVQSVSWWIESWPPTGNGTVVDSGTIALDSSGNGFTTDQTLPNGHYKLFWTFAGENGAAKHKVFWVSCPGPTQSPTPPPTTMTSATATATPTTPPPPPPAPTPTPVQSTLPVTG